MQFAFILSLVFTPILIAIAGLIVWSAIEDRRSRNGTIVHERRISRPERTVISTL